VGHIQNADRSGVLVTPLSCEANRENGLAKQDRTLCAPPSRVVCLFQLQFKLSKDSSQVCLTQALTSKLAERISRTARVLSPGVRHQCLQPWCQTPIWESATGIHPVTFSDEGCYATLSDFKPTGSAHPLMKTSQLSLRHHSGVFRETICCMPPTPIALGVFVK